MPERVYRVEEILTIVGVGYVRAGSKAEAREKAARGGAMFDWDEGQNVRRGDGIKAFTIAEEDQAFYDPGPSDGAGETRAGR